MMQFLHCAQLCMALCGRVLTRVDVNWDDILPLATNLILFPRTLLLFFSGYMLH